jgi:hypothetical protein
MRWVDGMVEERKEGEWKEVVLALHCTCSRRRIS